MIRKANCPDCDGDGSVECQRRGHQEDTEPCLSCDGTGTIDVEVEDDHPDAIHDAAVDVLAAKRVDIASLRHTLHAARRVLSVDDPTDHVSEIVALLESQGACCCLVCSYSTALVARDCLNASGKTRQL